MTGPYPEAASRACVAESITTTFLMLTLVLVNSKVFWQCEGLRLHLFAVWGLQMGLKRCPKPPPLKNCDIILERRSRTCFFTSGDVASAFLLGLSGFTTKFHCKRLNEKDFVNLKRQRWTLLRCLRKTIVLTYLSHPAYITGLRGIMFARCEMLVMQTIWEIWDFKHAIVLLYIFLSSVLCCCKPMVRWLFYIAVVMSSSSLLLPVTSWKWRVQSWVIF